VAEPDYRACAAAGITALLRWYDPATGLWLPAGWRNCANALTTVVRYTKLTGDQSHAGVLSTTFTAAQRQHAGFVNDYYDDNGVRRGLQRGPGAVQGHLRPALSS
jgi:hypothetical protein